MAKKAKQTKYVFVTGGVLSGLGKGITAASIGTVLKSRGLKVNIQKCDPYLNVDAGTLNPAEHGECFVTKDGAEADLDLGHYERFMDMELTQSSSLMSGRVLQKVISDERAGKYLGKTVQVIPHVTNQIQAEIITAGTGFDVHIVEIGGTVGDIEGLSFIEAIRELAMRVGRQNCIFVHVVYLPFLGTSKEFKTKPAQNAVHDLRGLGIVPDILAVRSEHQPKVEEIVKKLSMFTGVDERAVLMLPNANSIYEVPLTIEQSGIDKFIVKKLDIKSNRPNMRVWKKVATAATTEYQKTVKIGVIAKYMNNEDTYMSVFEALDAAGWANKVNVNIVWVSAEELESSKNAKDTLRKLDGILVPGGFGVRGVEGKILAADFALKNKKPYLGLCLGMQVAVIAAARSAGLKSANSTEFDSKTDYPVISTMQDQVGKEGTGGSMRLGDYTCITAKNSLSRRVYAKYKIVERHRHRYEANNDYRDQYTKWGIKASGLSPDETLVEMIEAVDHPFFIATQAHPEFKSRPNRPHPLFSKFIEATLAKSTKLN